MPDKRYVVVHKDAPNTPVTLPGESLVGFFAHCRATFLHATGWSDTEMQRRGFSIVPLDNTGRIA